MRKPLRVVGLVLATLLASNLAAEPLPEVTPARLNAGNAPAGDWLSYGGNYANWRYSPLQQINRDNASKIVPVWTLQTGIPGQVAGSPLIADGTLYFTAAHNNLYALDARTGAIRWHYEHQMPSDLRICCGPANRGVALAGNRVFMATLDARLIAFDRANGHVLWNVAMADYQAGYSASGAPLVVRDMVVVGSAGGEFASRGFIDAYNTADGKRRWRRYTVPAAGETGAETWRGDSWKAGGAPAWVTGIYDPTRNLLYWSTGNPSPLFNGDARSGDNLYSDSVLALDPDTGALRWHFQTTPHDVWDYDATNNLVLLDVQLAGKTVRAVAQANRNGYLYLLEASTGAFLRGAPYVEKLNWSSGLTEKGRPIVNPQFMPSAAGLKDFVCPGALGGNNGSFSYAYNPTTRRLYIPVIESCMSLTKESPEVSSGAASFGGSIGDTDGTAGHAAYGQLTAIDPVTGTVQWRYRDPYPLVGGALATGGGLIFTGNQQGFALALDDRTGRVLWQYQMGAGMRSQPMTFRLDNRQYVAIGSGSGGPLVAYVGQPPLRGQGSALTVFALPR